MQEREPSIEMIDEIKKMTVPLVSVVVTTHDREPSIVLRALRSIEKQTYTNIEVIVVDDSSPNFALRKNVKCAVIGFGYRGLKYIENGATIGACASRNIGISCSKGDYISLLDDDDEWKLNFLASIKQLIDRFPHAGAYATAYEYRSGITSVKPCYHYSHFAPDWCGIVPDYHLYAINSPIISASSVVVTKRAFNQVGMFPVGITRGEDLDMWSRIALKHDIVFKNTILSTYYLNADKRATQKTRDLEKSILKYAEERLSACIDDDEASDSYKEYLMKDNILLAEHYYHTGERKKAIAILWRVRDTKLNRKLWWKTLIKTTPLYPTAAKIRSLLIRSTNEK